MCVKRWGWAKTSGWSGRRPGRRSGIRILIAAGLNSDMVREILPCMVDDGGFLAPGCEDLIAEFERERRRIDTRIAELHDVRSALTGIISAGKAFAGR
ncbi:hypothetical protein ACWDV4_20035 [Micromonospora sp. NPDC003197]